MTDEARIELLAALVQRKWRVVKHQEAIAHLNCTGRRVHVSRRNRRVAQQELAAAQLLLQIAQDEYHAARARRPYMRPAIVAELEWKP